MPLPTRRQVARLSWRGTRTVVALLPWLIVQGLDVLLQGLKGVASAWRTKVTPPPESGRSDDGQR